ncbi:MAG TPA: D-alanine--D-alanine ligase [Gemmataceae bacterium]|nr:D-alanine--D-alanine ligase [Gemmataceae bacterium]
MKIGITFDLKGERVLPAGAPDDLFEEFDDPSTVKAIAGVLRDLGHEVVELGNGRPMLEKLLSDPPDFVFNFAEGQGIGRSRESRVPAVLETLGIKYTGSDPATLAVCLDKDWARRIVESVGVQVPRAMTIAFGAQPSADLRGMGEEILPDAGLDLPVIAKPVCEGSSKGIRNKCLIERAEDFGPLVYELWQQYHQTVLVEEFIDGEELTVGVWGNDPPAVIGILHVVPRKPGRFIYSLEVKRNYKELVDYECPAQISEEHRDAVEESALLAFDVLGCRDICRMDFRLREGVPYFLEANPLPGLNPITGDIVLLAKGMGINHAQLVERIVSAAMERQAASHSTENGIHSVRDGCRTE